MMTAELINGGKRKPIWGVISLCCPLVGVLLTGMALYHIRDGMAIVLGAITIMLFATFAGLVSVMVALARGEKFWPFTLLGMVLNAGPLVYFYFVR